MLALRWFADDGVENLVVEPGAVPGLIGIGDVFAEIVDADAHARAIDGLGDAHRVSDLGAGDKAAGNAADRSQTARQNCAANGFQKDGRRTLLA